MENGGSFIKSPRAHFMEPQKKKGPYAAAKAAANSLTQTLAIELAPNIRVNAIVFGPVSR